MTDEFHDPASYGALLADEYDAIYGDAFETEAAVDQLARLANGGRVLEFGVGTGRIALPLAQRGLDVWGVDGSAEMLTILNAKPGADKVTTLCGDFATTTAEGKFELVVLLINTIYAMGSQQGQIECFENAARHMTPGGRFVVEAWVPDPPRGDALGLKARRLGRGFAGLVIEDHDAARQLLSTTQIVIDGTGRTRSFPLVHRYAWPSELDLMARLAGMTLEHRWSDWHGHPFDARSTDHVSVWQSLPALNGDREAGEAQGAHSAQGEVGEILKWVNR
jgi:SAM-dependent methyltransferase